MIAVICFISGLIAGALFGIFAMALVSAASDDSRRREADDEEDL